MKAPVRASSKVLAVLLLAALAALCVGDIVHAGMASSDQRDCPSRICDEQTGCSASQTAAPALPPATAPDVASLPTPTAVAVLGGAFQVVTFSDRQVVPRAPRSPPFAS